MRCAGARTTCGSGRSGASSTAALPAPTRSTAQLHSERVAPATRAQLHHNAPLDELPDGAFVLRDGAPALVLGADLLSWTPRGYAERTPRPAGDKALVITPPSLLAVLRIGWEPLVPLLHPSAKERRLS